MNLEGIRFSDVDEKDLEKNSIKVNESFSSDEEYFKDCVKIDNINEDCFDDCAKTNNIETTEVEDDFEDCAKSPSK